MRSLIFLLVIAGLAGCVDDSESALPTPDASESEGVDFGQTDVGFEGDIGTEPDTREDVTADAGGDGTDGVDDTCEESCFDRFPALIVDSTVGGTDRYDSYNCAPETDESGPERVYKIVVSDAGFLAAQVMSEGENVDVDLHLLRADDSGECLDRGHITAGALVEPGIYFLSVDSWTDDGGTSYEGDFQVALNVVEGADLVAFGLGEQVAEDAVRAFGTAWAKDDSDRLEYTVTDFSIHSRFPRQWVLQMATGELLFHLTVAHGEGSVVGEDQGYASVFSNTPQSHQSSLGMILTAETYTGMFGYSMRLDGLEEGFNSKVRPRDIVVHPWNGNLPEVVAREGWVVSSWGCPALDPTFSTDVIDTISNGSLMFFWYPDPIWQLNSTYL